MRDDQFRGAAGRHAARRGRYPRSRQLGRHSDHRRWADLERRSRSRTGLDPGIGGRRAGCGDVVPPASCGNRKPDFSSSGYSLFNTSPFGPGHRNQPGVAPAQLLPEDRRQGIRNTAHEFLPEMRARMAVWCKNHLTGRNRGVGLHRSSAGFGKLSFRGAFDFRASLRIPARSPAEVRHRQHPNGIDTQATVEGRHVQ
jgi:hypothetical protein